MVHWAEPIFESEQKCFLSTTEGFPLSIKFAGTNLYSWVERGTVRVKCLAENTAKYTRPGFEPAPLDSESSVLTIFYLKNN